MPMRLVLVLIAATLPALAQAAELTIATFNAEFLTRPRVHVKFDLPFDLKTAEDVAMWDDPAFRDQKFAEGAAAVAAVVADINADIVVLTEVGDRRDVNELNAAIGAGGVSYPHVEVCDCTDTYTMQHVAVLSKIPLMDVALAVPGREGFFREADDDDSEDDTGISKGIIVSFTFGGEAIRLYGLHFTSEAGGADADAQRIAQASIIRRQTLSAIQSGDGHVIIAGDLNDDRGQPALRRIRGFDDIWPDLIQTGDHRYFDEADLGTRWTYEYLGARNQIDHILLSPSFETVLTGDGIRPRIPNQLDRLASDHRPFVLTLEFLEGN
jgi:endonuclease/exonuclease/phosphatase family metal-dependent hydrolase